MEISGRGSAKAASWANRGETPDLMEPLLLRQGHAKVLRNGLSPF
jgi:hypothetical protein